MSYNNNKNNRQSLGAEGSKEDADCLPRQESISTIPEKDLKTPKMDVYNKKQLKQTKRHDQAEAPYHKTVNDGEMGSEGTVIKPLSFTMKREETEEFPMRQKTEDSSVISVIGPNLSKTQFEKELCEERQKTEDRLADAVQKERGKSREEIERVIEEERKKTLQLQLLVEEQVREARNSVLHTSAMMVAEPDFLSITQDMILSEQRVRKESQDAAESIKKVRSSDVATLLKHLADKADTLTEDLINAVVTLIVRLGYSIDESEKQNSSIGDLVQISHEEMTQHREDRQRLVQNVNENLRTGLPRYGDGKIQPWTYSKRSSNPLPALPVLQPYGNEEFQSWKYSKRSMVREERDTMVAEPDFLSKSEDLINLSEQRDFVRLKECQDAAESIKKVRSSDVTIPLEKKPEVRMILLPGEVDTFTAHMITEKIWILNFRLEYLINEIGKRSSRIGVLVQLAHDEMTQYRLEKLLDENPRAGLPRYGDVKTQQCAYSKRFSVMKDILFCILHTLEQFRQVRATIEQVGKLDYLGQPFKRDIEVINSILDSLESLLLKIELLLRVEKGRLDTADLSEELGAVDIRASSLLTEQAVPYNDRRGKELCVWSDQKIEQKMLELHDAVVEGDTHVVSKILSTVHAVPMKRMKIFIDISLYRRDRKVASELLNYICKEIKEFGGEDFLYVWPAYQETARWEPVFVVLCRNNYQGDWDECLGFKVYKRRFDFVTPEAAKVINSKSVRENPINASKFIDLKVCSNQFVLNQEHSNITIINACPYRSRKGGTELIKETCIVIHCQVKGFIPFNENLFPKNIGDFPVDVREGNFILGVKTPPSTPSTTRSALSNDTSADTAGATSSNIHLANSATVNGSSYVRHNTEDNTRINTPLFSFRNKSRNGSYSADTVLNGDVEMLEPSGQPNVDELCEKLEQLKLETQFGKGQYDLNETLLIGTSISQEGNMSTGTLGGYVALPSGNIGFITCAHVVGTAEGKSVCQPSDGEIRTKHIASRRVCGHVIRAVFEPGSCDVPGVDAAVVEVTDRHPKDGAFIELSPHQLSSAGYTPDKPPKFSTGNILRYKDIVTNRRSDLIKVGSQTGLTRGMFYLANSFVQVSNESMRLPTGEMLKFFNQIEVQSFRESTVFFDLGDSGALVFMPLKDDELHCVGLAIGRTDYYSCLVTPIEDVLTTLKLDLNDLIKFTSISK